MSHRHPLARRVLESVAALIAPDVCAGCDERVPTLTIFCPPCAGTLERPRYPREGETIAYAYGGAVAEAITSFKYGGRVDRARPLSHLLRAAIGPLRQDPPTLVVAVPLHRSRLARRGFNQAALLAAPVARELRARFAPCALARTRDTPPQAPLERDARLANVADAFALAHDPRRIAGQRVLVVDDVRTTGATLAGCARALLDAGARDVRTLALAAADG